MQLCFLQYFELDEIQSTVLRPLAEAMAEPLELMAEDLWRMNDFRGWNRARADPGTLESSA